MWSKYWGHNHLSIILIITADPLGEGEVRCGAKEEWRTMIQDSTTGKCKKLTFSWFRKIFKWYFFLDLFGFKRDLTEMASTHGWKGVCHIFTFKKVIFMSCENSVMKLSGHFSGWWYIKLRWTLKFWIYVKSCIICVYSNIQTRGLFQIILQWLHSIHVAKTYYLALWWLYMLLTTSPSEIMIVAFDRKFRRPCGF